MPELASELAPALPGYRFTAVWQNITTIRSDSVFSPVPPETRQQFHIPDIDGESFPEWVRDCSGMFAVAKHNVMHRKSYAIFQGVAHEKIVADIADRLKMPVPPVLILERPPVRNYMDYFSVSPRVFPDAQIAPPREVLISNPLFAATPLLDGWTQNADRVPNNVLWGKIKDNQDYAVFLPDNGQASIVAPEQMKHVLKWWYWWDPPVRNEIKGKIASSPEVERVMKGIEDFPDDELSLIVTRLPNALFCSSRAKQRTIDGLKHGRDILRKEVNRAFALD